MTVGDKAGKHLLLISQPTTAESDERVVKLAEWMGVPTRRVTIEDGSATISQVLGASEPGDCCLAMSAATLAWMKQANDPPALRQFFHSHCRQLLIFTSGDMIGDDGLWAWITAGQVRRQNPATRTEMFHLPGNAGAFSQQFAGFSFSTLLDNSVSSFELARNQSADTQEILLADGRPVFVRTVSGCCETFLVAVSELPDIDRRLSHDLRIEEYYDELIPFLIFLRNCFGSSCWHAPASTARVIIDDPLITGKYGFLDYAALLSSTRSADYGATIAFIPWNHWRTSRKHARSFQAGGPRLSICVHGCDHTNKEFASVDDATLHWRARTALRRMESHEKRTGMPFERVMVFPQGWFSTPSIRSLRASNYLASVNTTCFPTDVGAESLTIADFLRPAVTRFDGFPVFQRRYPKRLVDCSFDLFLGRPALLVEHHQYFREGFGKIEKFINGLQQIEPQLQWTTLSSQLMRCCILRAGCGNRMDVQFFTRDFEFQNTRDDRTIFLLKKYEPRAAAVSAVLVNGARVPFSFEKNFLTVEVEVDPGRSVNVQILDDPKRFTPPAARPGLTYGAGVPVRRVLSEFRDNTLVKYPRLLQVATRLARKMKATADHDREDLL